MAVDNLLIIIGASVGGFVLIVIVFLLANPQRADGVVKVLRAIGSAFGRGGSGSKEPETKTIVIQQTPIVTRSLEEGPVQKNVQMAFRPLQSQPPILPQAQQGDRQPHAMIRQKPRDQNAQTLLQ